MVLDLVSMILSTSFPFVDHLRDLVQLVMSFVDVSRVYSTAEMAIEENKRAVFKSESHSYGTFVSFRICNIRLDRSHGNIENTSLNFGLGDQKNVKPMQISLSHKSVLGSTCMRIQNSHYVILHEAEPVAEVGPAGALVRQNVLNANDQDVRIVFHVV